MSETYELLPLVRKKVGAFLYPYGAFPDDDYEQAEGYETEYRSDDEAGARYRTEILVSAEKLVPLFLDLCQLLPETVCVSLERASADIYSRWDEFVSEQVPRQDFEAVLRQHQFAFAEDGNLGIGAFATEPPVEVFLGSHKEIVVFTPDRKAVAHILRQHGLQPRQLDVYYQRDHQHLALTEYRGLSKPDLDYVRVADAVRHVLGMSLRIEEDENTDEDGRPLGLVPWHAVVIVQAVRRARAHRRPHSRFLQEFGLTAASRREARQVLEHRLQRDGFALQSIEELFRVDPAVLPADVQPLPEALQRAGIWYVGEKSLFEPEAHD